MRLTCVLFLTVFSGAFCAWRPNYSSDNERVFAEVLEGVGANRDALDEMLNGAAEKVDKIVMPLADPDPMENLVCTGCLTLIEAVQTLQDLGMGWPDVREPVNEFCLELMTNLSARGDIMCEGILERYAPHIFTIVAHKSWDPSQICLKLLACDPDDITPPPPHVGRPMTQHAPKPRKISSNTITIAQVTDIHTDPQYGQGEATDCGTPVCCRQRYNGTGLSRRWGEYQCNLPRATAELYVRKVGELEPRPELVVYSGDNPPHALWEETYQGQTDESIFLTNTLKSHLPAGSKVYPAIGNHEIYPTNLYYMPRQEVKDFNTAFYNMWRDLAGFDDTNKATIEAAGYYTRLHKAGLRIVNYNSNYGYIMNWYNVINEERAEFGVMVNWLNTSLSAARAAGEKVILIGHHPSGGDMSYYSAPMTSILKAFSDIVVLHVNGHTHIDEFRVAVDAGTGAAKAVGLVCGTSGTRSDSNPMARVYTLDASTYELQDYTQYHLDINTQTDEEPAIVPQYSCREEYNMPDLSPASYLDLVNRMQTDDELFQKYRSNRRGRSAVEDEPCDAQCKKEQLCRLRTVTIEEYRACVKA